MGFATAMLSLWAAASFLMLPASAADDPINCKKFIKPGDKQLPHIECVEFDGWPRQVAGSNVDFYHYTIDFDRQNAVTSKAIDGIKSGIRHSFSIYRMLIKLPDVVIVLAQTLPPDLKGNKDDGVSQSVGNGKQCYIWIAEDAKIHDELGFQRIMAHEMFHCLERVKDPSFESTDQDTWWTEGAAEFFATDIYPDHHRSILIERYTPDNPLWRQSYAAGLFFAFLRNNRNWAYSRIFDLALQQLSTESDVAMRHYMSLQNDLVHNFPYFAQAYYDNEILFSDGLRAANNGKSKYKISVFDYTVSLAKDGTSMKTPIEADPFTIFAAENVLKSGMTYKFGLDRPLSKHGVLFYRNKESTKWIRFSTPQTIVADCGDDTTFVFLFTSTTDQDNDAALLSVTRKSKQACNCKRQADGSSSCPITGDGKGFILYPLEDAQGSAYCPTGTHISTVAAWCCPDGSNLDEARASQVSLCCPDSEFKLSFRSVTRLLTSTATDCYNDIIPNNLRCANPSWVLWAKENREIGCCEQGFVPTSLRYCVKDASKLGQGFTTVGLTCNV